MGGYPQQYEAVGNLMGGIPLRQLSWIGALLALGILIAGCGQEPSSSGHSTNLVTVSSGTPINIDPGTPSNKKAPNFTVTDQFNQRFSLSQYRGRVVLLAFQDSECTTICPLTSQEMVMAKRMLGPGAASQVTLLAVDANPKATSVQDVKNYSQVHGTMHTVLFGTAPTAQLSKIWHAYDIYVAVVHGLIDHTPGVFIINPQGRIKRVYMTQMAYNGIGVQAQIFAQEMARLLVHPTKKSRAVLSAARIKESTLHQLSHAHLPLATGNGHVTITNGHAHLLVFMASWLSETSRLSQNLRLLNQYQSRAKKLKLPSLIAVDEVPTEPSSHAIRPYLRKAGRLDYPVALDTTGAVAAKVGVEDLVWYALVNGRGQVIWAHDSSYKWLTVSQLEASVSNALAKSHG